MGFVMERQMRKEMGIMFKGPARAIFANNAQNVKSYDEAIKMVRRRYNNKENKTGC